MTPEERAHEAWAIIAANNGFIHQRYIEQQIAAAITDAINDKLDEVAAELEKLSSGTQTPAGLVRAMKGK